MKQLVIFDIDGTLADSKYADDVCYKQAFQEVLGFDIQHHDWADLQHVTDWGMAVEIVQNLRGDEITEGELAALKHRFITLLKAHKTHHPTHFDEVNGSKAFFDFIRHHPQYCVAIATGSWKESAHIKLTAIGIDPYAVPLSDCNLYMSRTDIIQAAIRASATWYATDFDCIVYFGDGVWDFRTCQQLNIPLIGVDCRQNGVLADLGLSKIIKDYTQKEPLMQWLMECRQSH